LQPISINLPIVAATAMASGRPDRAVEFSLAYLLPAPRSLHWFQSLQWLQSLQSLEGR